MWPELSQKPLHAIVQLAGTNPRVDRNSMPSTIYAASSVVIGRLQTTQMSPGLAWTRCPATLRPAQSHPLDWKSLAAEPVLRRASTACPTAGLLAEEPDRSKA